jgi:peptide/nickel transport system substrate-binding protein
LRQLFLIFLVTVLISTTLSCRRGNNEYVTIALSEKFSTLDTITLAAAPSAADERVRSLIFNSLVKKNEAFEYVGELAKEITISPDGLTVTFALRDGVKFQNGKEFTSADVKYTFDEMFKSNSYKSNAFFETVDKIKTPHIRSLETPDPRTVVVTVGKPAMANQLLSNLVAIPIIPEGSIAQQKDSPVGSGPFKFVKFDQAQNTVDFEANPDYWEGAPKVQKLRVKTVPDANSLQAELQTGGVDIAPLPTNLAPDTLKSLAGSPTLNVTQTDGSNIQYLIFNTASAPLDKVKVRQAIGYAIDREKIIKELLFGQARIAHSVVPPESWAYTPGTQYTYDPAKAKQLLQEAGYKGEPVIFKYGSGIAAVNNYSQVIQNALTDVGINVRIETLESGVIRDQLKLGQFQMYTGIWVGGNQDPIFLKDLFTTGKIPVEGSVSCCNRGRYSNKEVDALIDSAINGVDKAKAKEDYIKAQQKISEELPMLPLWYPANMVVANKRIGNIKISASGDWSFVKDITVN